MTRTPLGASVIAAAVAGAVFGLTACGASASAGASGGGGGGGGVGADAGSASAAAATAGEASPAAYRLSAPATAAGYPLGQPTAATTKLVDADIAKTAKRLGVSGSSVSAVYDDRADGAWVFYSGVNGSGFAPDKLHDALEQIPASTDDGSGESYHVDSTDTDPGPHGGRAICDTILVDAGWLTTSATTCSWFTPTTAASVTLVIKGDGTNTKVGFTAADVGPVMRAVRADVERRSAG